MVREWVKRQLCTMGRLQLACHHHHHLWCAFPLAVADNVVHSKYCPCPRKTSQEALQKWDGNAVLYALGNIVDLALPSVRIQWEL